MVHESVGNNVSLGICLSSLYDHQICCSVTSHYLYGFRLCHLGRDNGSSLQWFAIREAGAHYYHGPIKDTMLVLGLVESIILFGREDLPSGYVDLRGTQGSASS